MQELLSNLVFILERFTWASFLDIVLVTIVFAFILYLLRDTEAQTLLRGIFLIVILVTLLISLLDLPGFTWLVDTISPALIFAIPVVLAPEIRRGLERMGNVSSLSLFKRRSEKASENLELTLQAVTAAVLQLSQRRHGALIILRRKQFLDSYYKNGVLLDSIVTPQILMQIFYPNTPLHDGAVIIDENRIKAAACVMPLSSSGVLNATVDNSLGLRHRAALGISEVSDAIAVVVSEETGTISIAHRGRLIRRLDGDRLLNNMRAFMTSTKVLLQQKTWLSRFLSIFKRRKPEQKEEGDEILS
ncbi:MAG: diadenylate cyclase CdaA [Anaerolineaceae bacterium]|jgi:diadenylate cyclase|nr:diadenylate cyclase CdaA [Chloroflexota bacterium]